MRSLQQQGLHIIPEVKNCIYIFSWPKFPCNEESLLPPSTWLIHSWTKWIGNKSYFFQERRRRSMMSITFIQIFSGRKEVGVDWRGVCISGKLLLSFRIKNVLLQTYLPLRGKLLAYFCKFPTPVSQFIQRSPKKKRPPYANLKVHQILCQPRINYRGCALQSSGYAC